MKKLIALMLPWMVLGATIVAVVVLETLRTPDWRAALEAYVATRTVTETLAVQSVAEAEQPWHFEASMGELVRQEWTTWGTVEEIPYPPQDVRCVLLAQHNPPPGAKTSARRIVYVTYHSGFFRNSPGAIVLFPPRNPVTTRKRSVIPTNRRFLAVFRATEKVARQIPK
jgi:hypothetical protein